jgi:hypothetical protein
MSPHRLSCCSPLSTDFCKSARWLPPPPTATKHVLTAVNYARPTARNKTTCKSKKKVQSSGSSSKKRLADSNSAISNQLNSPLLRLPGEIRTTIYTYVCISTTANHGHPANGSKEGCAFTQTFLLACSQLYAEAVKLMYSLATFDLSSRMYEDSRLLCLKSLNPEYRHLITSIQVNAQFVREAMALIYGDNVEMVLGDHSPAKCLPGLERLHVRDLAWANARERDELRYLFDMEGLIITDHTRNGYPPRWSPSKPFEWYLERV